MVEHLGDRRVLAAITGVIFDDLDHSFRQEPGEASLPQRLVYLDANNNAVLETGERIAVADEAGAFRFEGLGDGDHHVRLFNGTEVQTQRFPFQATVETPSIAMTESIGLFAAPEHGALVLTPTGVEVSDLWLAENETISVGTNLSKLQPLGDGTFLVLGGEAERDTAWIVDPVAKTSNAIDLSGTGTPQRWSDVAVDGAGRGVLIGTHSEPGFVTALDASDPELEVVVVTTTTLVPADTTVIASDTGPRSVFAWAGEDGLKLSLWSNETASMITPEPIEVAGVSRLLDFDDESGLLVLRQSDGGVSVVDANADFATLHSFAEMTGPVTLDGARDLLMTVSPVESLLRVVDLRDGADIAKLAVNLATIGEVRSIASEGEPNAVIVLGTTGIVEVSLRRDDAHRVKIVDQQDASPIQFALSVQGDNTAPSYTEIPSLTTAEDNVLKLAAPGILAGVSDAQGDQFVVLQKGNAVHGVVHVGVDGSLTYTPNVDFYGDDSVTVTLHDGVSESDPFELSITVLPVADDPTSVVIQLDPVPEILALGEAVGLIEVIDADGINNHVIKIDDPRFEMNAHGAIVFVGGIHGEGLDFETEPMIPLTITVTDSETGTELVSYSAVTVSNANDPITGITPSEASVYENATGDTITELFVVDQDSDQFHILTVDDERFVIDGSDLRLADGVSLNYEETQQIVVNVTATEWGVVGAVPFTQAITVNVLDLPEQPEVLWLVGDTVDEFTVGAVVGNITLDGQPATDRFVLTVDDTRFQVVGGVLKLVGDQVVKRATQSEIELTVTAIDSHNEFQSLSSTFVISVLENATPFHNHVNPYDVDNGGSVTVADALAIINYLNVYAPGPVGAGNPALGYDVNADGLVTALDALLILNEINRSGNGGGTVGDGEQEGTGADGEKVVSPTPMPQIANGANDKDVGPNDPLRNDRAIVDTLNEEPLNGEPLNGEPLNGEPLNGDRNGGFEVAAPSDPRYRQIAADLSVSKSATDFSAQMDETIRLLSDPKA